MQISRDDAADALRDVEAAQTRAGEMRGYRAAAPYLIGWGLIWVIGYSLMAVRPMSEWGLIWLPLDLIGIGASIAAGNRMPRAPGAARAGFGRVIAAVLFVALYVAATYAVFAPRDVLPYLLYPGMVVGAVYVMIGLVWMPRLSWIGVTIFALSVAGLLIPHDYLLFWMAAVGGGGLMLSGFWLRSA